MTMTKRPDNFMKRIAIDIGGILLLIMALLVGWLPGPLGIPLVIAGLSLLAINHTWAEKWMERVKQGGVKIMDKIFSDNPKVKWLLDIGSVVLLASAAYIFANYDRRLLVSLATALMFMSIVLFLGNRGRLNRLLHFVKLKR